MRIGVDVDAWFDMALFLLHEQLWFRAVPDCEQLRIGIPDRPRPITVRSSPIAGSSMSGLSSRAR